MTARQRIRGLLFFGVGCLIPCLGLGDVAGGVMVFAWDTSAPETAPPSTTAYLDGVQSQTFEGNDLVTFMGYFEEGIHSVEVSTDTHGFILRESPTDPDAVNDPYSDYGNPRYTELSAATNIAPVGFQFDPVITASAVVRDAWTMERLENVAIEFLFEIQDGSKIATTKYPWIATYATNWHSNTDGTFPENTILYLDDYELVLSMAGYQTFSSNNIIMNASPGDSFNLGTLFLYPVDDNGNQISDAWETLYFGAGSTVESDADADADGMSNRDEYLAGTDPTDWHSCLLVESSVHANTIELAWNTQQGRTYCVSGTTNLSSGEWVQVGGPWEALDEQTYMSWSEDNLDLSRNSSYRVEVVPSGWQGTNQVLNNTYNQPPATYDIDMSGIVANGLDWPFQMDKIYPIE